MIRNFFKIAWRNIVKNKTFSFINIFGLAMGLACFLLIAMYVFDELSYDRFHKQADRIYRINSDLNFGGSDMKLAVTSDPLGSTLKNDYPEVEQFARIYNSNGARQVKKGNDFITEAKVAYVDSTFFEVFTFPAIEGEIASALNEPNTVVLTESTALKYFGKTDIIGETIEVSEGANSIYKITAVIEDMPKNSHFHFDFLFSMDNVNYNFGTYLSHNFHTYLLLKNGTNAREFEKHFDEVIQKYILPQASEVMNIKSMDEFEKAGNGLSYSLMPITEIHLHSNRFPELEPVGNIRNVYIFGAVALFILLLACINFINLSTANSGSRAKEIGIRKVLGSEKRELVRQFLAESVLTALLATCLALIIVWGCLSVFNDIATKEMSMISLFSPITFTGVISLAIITGLIAGAYPSFYISSFQPIAALKGKLNLSSHKSYLRNVLVVMQFATAIILIIGTLVVYNQLTYIQHAELGYQKDQVLIIDDTYPLGEKAEAFKQTVAAMPGVKMASMAGYLPVSSSSRSDNTFATEAAMTTTNTVQMQNWKVDYSYIPTLGMEIVQGRNFSKEFGTDSIGIIINETCAKMLGGGNVIGRKLYAAIDDRGTNEAYTVIGVVKNFNFQSLREEIGPLSMKLGDAYWAMAFKVDAQNIPVLIRDMEKQFKSMAVGKPFSYRFLDDAFDEMYRTEQRMGKLTFAFSVLAIIIACLGLFGLATYMAQQRIKEIGVRKVLGASVLNIVQMLSSDFIKLVGIAAFIAFPIAWFIMHKWLEDFAYRTAIQWWVFLLAGALCVCIALFTVGFQAVKAALANPVKSLRTE